MATPPKTGNPLPVAMQPLGPALAEIVAAVNKVREAIEKQKGTTERATAASAAATLSFGKMTAGLSVLQNVTGLALNSLHQLTGAISANVASFVKMYSPADVVRLDLAVKDLNAAIGAALVPTLLKMTVLVRGVGDVIASLSGPSRGLIAALVSAGVGMVALTVTTELFAAAAASATGGLSLVLGAVAGGLAAVAFVSKDLDAVKSAVQGVSVVARQFVEVLGAAFGRVATAAQPVIDKVAALAAGLAGPLANFLESVTGNFAGLIEQIVPVVQSVLPAVTQAVTAVLQLSAGLQSLQLNLILGPLVQLFGALVPVLDLLGTPVRLAVTAFGTLAQVVGGVLGPMIGLAMTPLKAVGQVFGAVAEAVGGAVGELQEAFSEVGALAREIGGVINELSAELLKALKPFTDALKDVALGAIRTTVDAIRGLASWLTEIVRRVREFLGIEARERIDPKGKSEGLAVRQVTTGSVQAAIDRAQTAALNAGRKAEENPMKKSADHLGRIRQYLETGEWAAKLAGAIAKAVKESKAGRTADAVGGAAGGVVSGFFPVGTVRMITG